VRPSGTVNAIFRIGTGLAARFPLRVEDPRECFARLEREAQAARDFAAVSAVPAPVPLAIGEPGEGYPLHWSVQSWLPGTVATPTGLAASEPFAEQLAAFIRSLRAAHTRGRRFAGTGRGGDLTDHDAWMATCLLESTQLLDTHAVGELWATLRELPRVDTDVMSHQDLIPANLLVDGERLTGVLDCGGFGPADPALDLVAGWHLLDAGPRAVLRTALQCDDTQWLRGKAWALEQAMGLVWYYRSSHPEMSALGRSTVARILAD
jgi:aminoglycoside phosphotransferase (APT) family kinase protein